MNLDALRYGFQYLKELGRINNMFSCLMFSNLTHSEECEVIHTIESNGADFLGIDYVADIVEVKFTSEYPLREQIIHDLIKNHNDIYNKMC